MNTCYSQDGAFSTETAPFSTDQRGIGQVEMQKRKPATMDCDRLSVGFVGTGFSLRSDKFGAKFLSEAYDALTAVLHAARASASSAYGRHVRKCTRIQHELVRMHKIGHKIEDPAEGFANFQRGLRRVLEVSPEEIRARIAADNTQRTAERVQRGYLKRGPKGRKVTVCEALKP